MTDILNIFYIFFSFWQLKIKLHNCKTRHRGSLPTSDPEQWCQRVGPDKELIGRLFVQPQTETDSWHETRWRHGAAETYMTSDLLERT